MITCNFWYVIRVITILGAICFFYPTEAIGQTISDIRNFDTKYNALAKKIDFSTRLARINCRMNPAIEIYVCTYVVSKDIFVNLTAKTENGILRDALIMGAQSEPALTEATVIMLLALGTKKTAAELKTKLIGRLRDIKSGDEFRMTEGRIQIVIRGTAVAGTIMIGVKPTQKEALKPSTPFSGRGGNLCSKTLSYLQTLDNQRRSEAILQINQWVDGFLSSENNARSSLGKPMLNIWDQINLSHFDFIFSYCTRNPQKYVGEAVSVLVNKLPELSR